MTDLARVGRRLVIACAIGLPAAAPVAAQTAPATCDPNLASAPAAPPVTAGEICATIDAPYQEVDASVDPDRARAFDVWRAPTLFVLDHTGAPVWRATGVPTKTDLEAAVRP